MGTWIDRTGMRYGKLVCQEYLGDGYWKCLCDCGNERILKTSYFTTGKTKSCGCLRQKYHINEEFFDNINTEEKAYILGIFAADGNVSKVGNNIKLELKEEDIDILEKIKKAMDYNFDLIHYNYKSYFNKSEKIYENNLVRLNITNKHIYLKIQEYGIIPNKSRNLNINLDLIPDELLCHFLRGLWDGDGSISINKKNRKIPQPTINLTVSNIMYDKIYNILSNKISNFVAYGYYRYKEKKYTKTLIVGNKESLCNVLEYMYKNATIYLDRKYKKYLEIKDLYTY